MEAERGWASVGDDRIAYELSGVGPLDVVYWSGSYTNLDVLMEEPSFAHFIKRLSSFSRVIRFDKRGSGTSDPLPLDALPSWENTVEDLAAVLDEVGSDRPAIISVHDAGPTAMLFAAIYPQRVSALVLGNTTSRFLVADDYPQGTPPEAADLIVQMLNQNWGTERLAASAVPSMAGDEAFAHWYAKFQRSSCSPKAVAAYTQHLFQLDVRDALASIQAPTLVMHRSQHAFFGIEQGRYLADRIPNAKFTELPGGDILLYTEGSDKILNEIEEFLTGAGHQAEPDRSLATVLFTDMVGSTERATQMGDRRWRELLERFETTSRNHVSRFGGRLVEMTGDGALATFETPGQALRCAFALHRGVAPHGVKIRAGVHTGEIENRGAQIGGIAVHLAARVLSKADAEEVVCTRTVKDLVAGSGFSFESRGHHPLKGLDEEWELFSAQPK
ncbi:MAG TPA: adenylate/guanylate cyclase domain-containing protein [Actinomycetota bacterium]|nr:adenylate/guanylate cyclase domain-containing protein [Actinomycetota bacterium]